MLALRSMRLMIIALRRDQAAIDARLAELEVQREHLVSRRGNLESANRSALREELAQGERSWDCAQSFLHARQEARMMRSLRVEELLEVQRRLDLLASQIASDWKCREKVRGKREGVERALDRDRARQLVAKRRRMEDALDDERA